MPPRFRVYFIADMSSMKANVLVHGRAKIDSPHLATRSYVCHSKKICRNLVDRMAGELQQIKRKDFIPEGRKHPIRKA